MNPLMEEHLAQEHRTDIVRELSIIRVQEQALKGMVFRPNIFTHTMRGFGRWLIVRGEKLVKRYEVPSNCAGTTKHGFAH